MTLAVFRFYEELNDFLAPDRRKRDFELRCAESATVKNAIESVGVPHTEVELVLANGASVDWSYRVRDGDRISVYPMFERFDVTPLLRLRPEPLQEVVERLQLAGQGRPFTRCLCCNEPLLPVAKAEVLPQLPPAVAAGQQLFKRCPLCLRVYWPGDHYRRMSAVLRELVGASGP